MPQQRFRARPFPVDSARGRRQAAWFAFGAGLLAGTALAVQARTRRVEREHPPRGRFVEVEGVRLHYLERGAGETVVFLHGNGDMAEDIDISGLLDRIAERYRVIVFDRPGYGHSTRPRDRAWTPQAQAGLIHHALATLGVERPIVVGHSWGTQVALRMALAYPTSLRSLVLLAGYYYPTLRFDVAQLSLPAIPLIGDLLRHTLSPVLSRWMWPLMARRMFSPRPVPQRFRDEFPVWMALRPKQLRASAEEAAMMVPAASLVHLRYPEIGLPVVLLGGDGDRMVKTAFHDERLAMALPDAERRVAQGAGHMLHYLAPEQVLSAIDAAAARTRGGVPRQPDPALYSAGAVGT